MNDLLKITFVSSGQLEGLNSYRILYTDNEKEDNRKIDYLGTVLQIKPVSDNFYFEINENYNAGTYFDGLELLLRIRLSYFFNPEIALAPIVIYISSPIENILKSYPRYSILFSEGITIRNNNNQREIKPPPRLRKETLLHILSIIPILPDKQKNRHSSANEWGALRLILGILFISNKNPNFKNLLLKSKIADDPYYWSLLSLEELTRKSTNISQANRFYSSWEKFLSKSNNLNILIIDDELDKGWSEAFDLIFNVNNSGVMVDYLMPTKDDSIDSVKNNLNNLLHDTEYDLIICDLRLLSQDQSQNMAEDQSRVSELTGSKLISVIKQFNPTIPVLTFTASNKVWTFKVLEHELGIDGYWMKESPELGVSADYAQSHTEVLLDTIRNLILHKRSYKFIWELILAVRATRLDTKKTKAFVINPSNVLEIEKVAIRLGAIESLLLRTYAVIYRDPMPFLQQHFKFSPFEQSFIYLWGCLTELAWLRVKLYQNEDCLLLFSNGKRIVFTNFQKPLISSFKVNKSNLFNKAVVPKELLRSKRVPNPWLAFTKPTDTWFISLLLYQIDDKSYYEYFKILREKRNNIDFIHGDSVTIFKKNHSIIPDDLSKLTQLIKVLLSA